MEQDEKGISRERRPRNRLVQGPGGEHPGGARSRELERHLEAAAAMRAGGFEAVEQGRAVEGGVGAAAIAAADAVEVLGMGLATLLDRGVGLSTWIWVAMQATYPISSNRIARPEAG